MIETLKFLYDLDISDDMELDATNPLSRPRIPHEIMFAIGGWSGGSPTNAMEVYDTRADKWNLTPWGDPLGKFDPTKLDSKIFWKLDGVLN